MIFLFFLPQFFLRIWLFYFYFKDFLWSTKFDWTFDLQPFLFWIMETLDHSFELIMLPELLLGYLTTILIERNLTAHDDNRFSFVQDTSPGLNLSDFLFSNVKFLLQVTIRAKNEKIILLIIKIIVRDVIEIT